jgi:hypothetical protein
LATFELRSQRMKRLAKAGVADVYRYDEIPQALRVQVIRIWERAIGPYLHDPYGFQFPPTGNNNQVWRLIHDQFATEKGVFTLGLYDPMKNCADYLMSASTEDALDLIDFTFRRIARFSRLPSHTLEEHGIKQDPGDAIDELNLRFKRAGFGYQFERGQLVRVDSHYVHEEVVKPALDALAYEGFEGADAEFRQAHKHYRDANYKDAIVNALNAFESTLKVLCKQRDWPHSAKAKAPDLIRLVFDNGLLPSHLRSGFEAFERAMEKGLPPMRNEGGAHGQGGQIRQVPPYLAAHAIHLAAANIVLVVSAHLSP